MQSKKGEHKMLYRYDDFIEEAEKMRYVKVKTSLAKGYVSREAYSGNACEVVAYNGRFGRGYKVKRPNWESSRYCYCEYWIKES